MPSGLHLRRTKPPPHISRRTARHRGSGRRSSGLGTFPDVFKPARTVVGHGQVSSTGGWMTQTCHAQYSTCGQCIADRRVQALPYTLPCPARCWLSTGAHRTATSHSATRLRIAALSCEFPWISPRSLLPDRNRRRRRSRNPFGWYPRMRRQGCKTQIGGFARGFKPGKTLVTPLARMTQ